MRRRTAPFGNDLQDDFDVRLINGRIVQISKYPLEGTKKTLKEEQTDSSKQQTTVKTGYHDSNYDSPRDKHKLPPIQPAAGKPHSKSTFHSAPPKLLTPKRNSKPSELEPLSRDSEPTVSDSLVMFNRQLLTVQRKRPHTLEDIECSCRRLDAFRSGTISLQELANLLYINGISINKETLREFCDHSNLDITDGNRVSYKDFVSKISVNSSSSNHRDSVNTQRQVTHPRNSITILEMEERNRNQKLLSHHRERQTTEKNNNLSSDNDCVLSRMIVSCPDRVSMAATHDIIDDDDDSLLDDLQDCFSGKRWGNHGDVQRLESRLAMADKHHQGLLPSTVVCVVYVLCCVILCAYHT